MFPDVPLIVSVILRCGNFTGMRNGHGYPGLLNYNLGGDVFYAPGVVESLN